LRKDGKDEKLTSDSRRKIDNTPKPHLLSRYPQSEEVLEKEHREGM
jgi:hypothetical protein